MLQHLAKLSITTTRSLFSYRNFSYSYNLSSKIIMSDPITALEPPSKSSLKKAEKMAQLAAKKALKEVSHAATGLTAPVPGGKKKEKPVVVVVEELPFIEVPIGHKKGEMEYRHVPLQRESAG